MQRFSCTSVLVVPDLKYRPKAMKASRAYHMLLCSRPLAGLLRITADDLDLVCRDRLGVIVHLKCDVLDQKGPDFVTEAIRIEASLKRIHVSYRPIPWQDPVVVTLNCSRAFTLFCRASVMAWSKFPRIFMAS